MLHEIWLGHQPSLDWLLALIIFLCPTLIYQSLTTLIATKYMFIFVSYGFFTLWRSRFGTLNLIVFDAIYICKNLQYDSMFTIRAEKTKHIGKYSLSTCSCWSTIQILVRWRNCIVIIPSDNTTHSWWLNIYEIKCLY